MSDPVSGPVNAPMSDPVSGPVRDPVNPDDPKGLIRESYRIDGIGGAECRSILVDWALSLPPEVDPRAAMARLIVRHGEATPDHPMTQLLRAALLAPDTPPSRRGGATGRRAAVTYPDTRD
jgi:hypothetical protein